MSDDINIGLPMDKLSIGSAEPEQSPKTQPKDTTYVVLVSTGSFNPPTYMHLRIFELARDALNSEGFCVIGGYMSPVNDAYQKRCLISAKHRIEMCHLACRSSEFIMVDPWEASQDTFQRTLTVLCRIKGSLCDSGRISGESLKVMLVCGSDLLESFSIPGAWIPEQVRTICRDFGVVCIHREGQDIEKVISNDDILNEYKYKFFVDGEWRHDEHQPFVSGNYGVVNSVFLAREPDVIPAIYTPETPGRSSMDVHNDPFFHFLEANYFTKAFVIQVGLVDKNKAVVTFGWC